MKLIAAPSKKKTLSVVIPRTRLIDSLVTELRIRTRAKALKRIVQSPLDLKRMVKLKRVAGRLVDESKESPLLLRAGLPQNCFLG
jgi:hypothetical protein